VALYLGRAGKRREGEKERERKEKSDSYTFVPRAAERGKKRDAAS